MELLLKSGPSVGARTPGVLYIDGAQECLTLEDQVREIPGRPVAEWKVKGATAIPAGRYRLAWTMSARFKRMMIQIMDVPGFSGIRMHSGSTELDTEGCPLVGDKITSGVISGGLARRVLMRLEAKVKDTIQAGEEAWITVERA